MAESDPALVIKIILTTLQHFATALAVYYNLYIKSM